MPLHPFRKQTLDLMPFIMPGFTNCRKAYIKSRKQVPDMPLSVRIISFAVILAAYALITFIISRIAAVHPYTGCALYFLFIVIMLAAFFHFHLYEKTCTFIYGFIRDNISSISNTAVAVKALMPIASTTILSSAALSAICIIKALSCFYMLF